MTGAPCGGDSEVCCLGLCVTPICFLDTDCGGGYVPTHSKEKGPRCSDGLDNDCNGLIDGADPDC